MSKKLTQKQKKFADSYIESGNATKAAKKAYKPSNDASARSIGSQNLTKLNIQDYLEEQAQPVLVNMVHLALHADKQSDQIKAGKIILDRTIQEKPTTIHLDSEERKKEISEKIRTYLKSLQG
jgi:phage terminase small subunit